MIADDRSPLRYVALGDSYTIGTGVDPGASWPAQLAEALASSQGRDGTLDLVANLGVNGCTSDELRRDQLPELDRFRPGFASLLIGVNDVVRGTAAGPYEANLRAIFEVLLARLARNRILTVAIPDYTAAPRGADYGDPAQQSREIAAFNAIMSRLSSEHGVRYVDIVDLSLRATADRSLVAPDGLHPSAAQYGLWVGRIAPVVAGLLVGGGRELSDRPA